MVAGGRCDPRRDTRRPSTGAARERQEEDAVAGGGGRVAGEHPESGCGPVAEKGKRMKNETPERRNERLDREFIARRTGQSRGASWQDNAYLYAKAKRRQTIAPGVVIVWAR
jgi:hypothetical protein